MRRASFLRSFALRCSLTAIAVPVTVGMEAMDRRPKTILCGCLGGIDGLGICSTYVIEGTRCYRRFVVRMALEVYC